MSFQGSLAELHLPDILQLMAASGKTGAFHLDRDGAAGLVYLRDGKIVHAALGDEQGEEAIYTLATWGKGSFRFEAGETSPAETIARSNTSLLMEAARRLDEWRVLQRKIPSVDLVPEFVVQQHKEGQINLNTSEWLLLSKIDGVRSIKGIAQEAGISVFDAAKVLYGLVASSLLKLNEPQPQPVVAGAPPASRSPLSGPVPVSQPPLSGSVELLPAQPPLTAGSPVFGTPTRLGAASPSMPTPLAPMRVRAASDAATAAASAPTQTLPSMTPMQAELARLARVKEICNNALGAVGGDIIEKHYQKARLDIEAGNPGPDAIAEAVHQIGRAAAILKGPSVTEALLAQIKLLR
jgi:hypothetical protein